VDAAQVLCDARREPARELYERLFDQFSDQGNPQHFYNVLLIASIVQTIAVDTSICERGFSLMNNLKTAKRSQTGTVLFAHADDDLHARCRLERHLEDPRRGDHRGVARSRGQALALREQDVDL